MFILFFVFIHCIAALYNKFIVICFWWLTLLFNSALHCIVCVCVWYYLSLCLVLFCICVWYCFVFAFGIVLDKINKAS